MRGLFATGTTHFSQKRIAEAKIHWTTQATAGFCYGNICPATLSPETSKVLIRFCTCFPETSPPPPPSEVNDIHKCTVVPNPCTATRQEFADPGGKLWGLIRVERALLGSVGLLPLLAPFEPAGAFQTLMCLEPLRWRVKV